MLNGFEISDRWNMTENKVNAGTRNSKQKARPFRVGDLAVYPAHGVGEIQAIESRVVNGEKHDFYIMK
ncbi:MAG: CarD family transcriptional regulator, partial [Desulfobacterales bacterium]